MCPRAPLIVGGHSVANHDHTSRRSPQPQGTDVGMTSTTCTRLQLRQQQQQVVPLLIAHQHRQQ